jgi:hypothetical protein
LLAARWIWPTARFSSGNRPPITLRPGSGPLTVRAIAKIEDIDDDKPVWRNVTESELARQVTPRSGVSMDDVYAGWRERSSAFRARHVDGSAQVNCEICLSFGVWAAVPWISVFDPAIMTSATGGYYT